MIDSTCFIGQGAAVMGRVQIGRESSVWYGSVIRGDMEMITIGEGTNIQDLSMIHADPGFPCLIGDRVTVGHRVILHGCTVEDDCMIGMGAIVLNGVKLGRGSVVGAGAVVLEGTEIPPGSLVVGIPARVARPVDATTLERMGLVWRHYVEQAAKHRAGEFPIVPSSIRE